MKEEIVDIDEIINFVKEIEDDRTIKDLKKEYPEKIMELEEALLNYMGEIDLKISKQEIPDKWKYLTKKLVSPYEYFRNIEDYQKPVNNLKKENFLGKLKNDYPSDEIETKEIIKIFNIKNGELTQIYLKSDVLLLACVFENFIKVSVNEFDINPLYCISLPVYTRRCAWKYTGRKSQTLQDKDLILTLENNIRGGIGSIMGRRYVKSDEDKKILYFDANNLYGHSMSQMLPYDEIEMWHCHPDLYMDKLEILNTPDDSDIGCFAEVDLRYLDTIKERTKIFPFCPENKVIHKDKYNAYMNKIKPKNYIKAKNLICDWTDKKNYLTTYNVKILC